MQTVGRNKRSALRRMCTSLDFLRRNAAIGLITPYACGGEFIG